MTNAAAALKHVRRPERAVPSDGGAAPLPRLASATAGSGAALAQASGTPRPARGCSTALTTAHFSPGTGATGRHRVFKGHYGYFSCLNQELKPHRRRLGTPLRHPQFRPGPGQPPRRRHCRPAQPSLPSS